LHIAVLVSGQQPTTNFAHYKWLHVQLYVPVHPNNPLPGFFRQESKVTTHNPGAGAAVISAFPTQNVKHGAFRSSATLKYRLSPKLHPPFVDFGLTVPPGHVCAARFGRTQQQWWPWQPLETVLKAMLLVPADLVLCTSFLSSPVFGAETAQHAQVSKHNVASNTSQRQHACVPCLQRAALQLEMLLEP
jgi:hypothetical protein